MVATVTTVFGAAQPFGVIGVAVLRAGDLVDEIIRVVRAVLGRTLGPQLAACVVHFLRHFGIDRLPHSRLPLDQLTKLPAHLLSLRAVLVGSGGQFLLQYGLVCLYAARLHLSRRLTVKVLAAHPTRGVVRVHLLVQTLHLLLHDIRLDAGEKVREPQRVDGRLDVLTQLPTRNLSERLRALGWHESHSFEAYTRLVPCVNLVRETRVALCRSNVPLVRRQRESASCLLQPRRHRDELLCRWSRRLAE
mmetsp:Transcript_71963/g.105435  ORF Transcript_71963/g.105435 Transcript_71963/m.105435 type:complete len:248 (+) Transcript_71963:549-1292(+)